MALQSPHPAAQDAMAGWWPSRYGAGDEAGALNEVTPDKVLEAIRLVRQGLVYDLAHVLHQDIPAFPGRTFRQYLTTNYHHINRRRPDAGPAAPASTGSPSRSRPPSSYGPYPPQSPDEPFAVPQLLNVRHGVVVVENLRLADAARDRLGEFLLVIPTPNCAGPPAHGGCRWRSCEGSIMTDHYDVIVIGSGAGGGTLTHLLRRDQPAQSQPDRDAVPAAAPAPEPHLM